MSLKDEDQLRHAGNIFDTAQLFIAHRQIFTINTPEAIDLHKRQKRTEKLAYAAEKKPMAGNPGRSAK